jgi:hypothetical protein
VKVYRGDPKTGLVTVELMLPDRPCEYLLPMRLGLRNHSPTGFAWGYGGSGPAQLALALACDMLGPGKVCDDLALAIYQELKWSVISRLPGGEPFRLTEDELRTAIEGIVARWPDDRAVARELVLEALRPRRPVRNA